MFYVTVLSGWRGSAQLQSAVQAAGRPNRHCRPDSDTLKMHIASNQSGYTNISYVGPITSSLCRQPHL